MASTNLARLGTKGSRISDLMRSMAPSPVQASGKEEIQAWAPSIMPELSHDVDEVIRQGVHMVFLGPPGAGKGTWASRLANLLKVPHIAMGDLVRTEISRIAAMAEHMNKITTLGRLLPNEVVFDLLCQRLETGVSEGEAGFILDGFPRTLSQAKIMAEVAHIDLVVNLRLREDVLVAKCLGRRTCTECRRTFNVIDVNVDGIRLPAILPPPSCAGKLKVRADDVDEDVVGARMGVYRNESRPVEEFYRSQGMLLDFDIRGGIPETWSQLLSALHLEAKPLDVFNAIMI